MKVIVYADESGTHDKAGMEPGSEVAVTAGYAGKVDGWIKFCKDWQAVFPGASSFQAMPLKLTRKRLRAVLVTRLIMGNS